MMLRVVLLVSMAVVCLAEQKRYDGYQVLRLQPTTELQHQALSLLLEVPGIDFWRFPEDLMVPPSQLESVKEYIDVYNINFRVWIKDVQRRMDQVHSDKPSANEFDYSVYHTLDEIMAWINLVADTYPDLVSKMSIGKSYEGRDLAVLKLGADTGKEKKSVWIQGMIHPREWISPATIMWMTNQLLEDYTIGNLDVVNVLETYDIYVLTVLNPDGYHHSWTVDRLWRKTLSPNDGSGCLGTDGNRNFNYQWGLSPGSSSQPCSESYRGDSALSEDEVRSVVEFVSGQTFELFLDYHGYGQALFSAWGYTSELPADYSAMESYMKVHTDAINAVHGKVYNYVSPVAITSGDSVDFAYGGENIIHSFSVLVRDEGDNGHFLPSDEIIPCSEENYAGLVAGLQHLADL